MKKAVDNILDYHFRFKEGREIIILFDKTKKDFAEVLSEGIRERNGRSILVKIHDMEILPDYIDRLFQDEEVGLIALVSHHMWVKLGLSDYFVMPDEKPSLRAKCSPQFFDCVIPMDSLLRMFSSDYNEDLAYLDKLKTMLKPDVRYRIITPEGTDINFVSRDWKVDKYTEIRTSPVEGTINGNIIADANAFYTEINTPIELTIKNGRIVEISCQNKDDMVFQKYKSFMDNMLKECYANWQLAEVGIGICSNAQFSGLIMEDEAVKGSAHFCFGDNSRYGGKSESSFHGGTVVIKDIKIEEI